MINLFVVNANCKKGLKLIHLKNCKIDIFKVLRSNQDVILNKYKFFFCKI